MSLGIINQPACPPATLDIGLNLKNRQKAINVAMYGPPNPALLNNDYWRRLASIWGTNLIQARSMRCGNCAAFDVKPRTIECIKKGLTSEGIDPYDTVVAAELGYCRAFRFKCAASRTCSAWVVGGPIR